MAKYSEIGFKEALYIGRGKQEAIFAAQNGAEPARFYLNLHSGPYDLSDPPHHPRGSDVVTPGAQETSNHRIINKLLVNSVLPTCQLQMGMTELKSGQYLGTPHARGYARPQHGSIFLFLSAARPGP